MEVIIAIIISSIISCLTTRVMMNRKSPIVGTLVIDRSDPGEPPYSFLEINSGVGGVDGIARNKLVQLNVRNENYITQE